MIFKLIGIAIIGVITVTLLKTAKPEFAVFATIATGIVMVITMLSALRDVVLAFDGIVEKSGSWFSYNGDKIGQGRDNVCEYLKVNSDLMEQIKQQVLDAMKKN